MSLLLKKIYYTQIYELYTRKYPGTPAGLNWNFEYTLHVFDIYEN